MAKPRTRRQGEGTDPTRAAVRGAQRAATLNAVGLHAWRPQARRFADRTKTTNRRACRGPIRGDWRGPSLMDDECYCADCGAPLETAEEVASGYCVECDLAYQNEED